MSPMIDTFYLHLEFKCKNTGWSINLPFLCTKCGVCCTLEDFLTAGETKASPEVDANVKALFYELGGIWEESEAKYDNYVAKTPCPFLVDDVCSIYEFRPEGCRLFPKTAFGMQTRDCIALTRLIKQRAALKKGRVCKETYHFVSSKNDEPITPAKNTERQYQNCIARLEQAGITKDELAFFKLVNAKSLGKSCGF